MFLIEMITDKNVLTKENHPFLFITTIVTMVNEK